MLLPKLHKKLYTHWNYQLIYLVVYEFSDQESFWIIEHSKKLHNNAFYCLVIPTNAKTKLLIPVQCSLFDTNSRRRINVALFVSFRATKNYKVSVAVKTCFQLPKFLTFLHFFLLQSIRVSIFYGLELVFKVSFRVRTRFRIRINKVMSVWQLATTVAAILALRIRHSCGFTFVAG